MSGHPEELDHCGDGGEHFVDCICVPSKRFVTHEDLENETKAVMKQMAKNAETIRDQLYYLHKLDTLGMMAATMYGKTTQHADVIAKNLYQKVELSLEKDRAIVGQIRRERT